MISKNHLHRTKIIATCGPATDSYEKMLELVEAGVNVFRFNFSHGDHSGHLKFFNYVKKINENLKYNIGILADLQGPKIRIGEVENGGVHLISGSKITLTCSPQKSNAEKVYVSYDFLARDIRAGERILIDDGKLELLAGEKIDKNSIEAKVLYGGELFSRKGVNLPDSDLSVASITDKDKADLKFAIEQEANWIALSFVRKAKDIRELKSMIPDTNEFKVIAKIEKPEGVANIDDIIVEADAIMIARGDLGIEVPLEKMPLFQKQIIKKCIDKAKPVIVATQILDSMIEMPTPTRAETNDVANDIMDGADALMLSGETSVGKHPVKAIQTLKKITDYIEANAEIYNKNLVPQLTSKSYLSDAICYNASRIAAEIGAQAIVGMTRSGYTAFMVSSFRPNSNIFIFTDNRALLNILSLVWGVKGFYYDKFVSTDETIFDVVEFLKKIKMLKTGDVLVNTASMPMHKQGKTNMLKVTKVE
ncbi:MAG: pyruvate kinase [Chitinophagales bacterium]